LAFLQNGFINVQCTVGKLTFFHMLCVKNGYLIDSINSRVYRFNGKLVGYTKYIYVAIYDLDQVPDPVVHEVFDLT
jgi:hypothetical protein